MNMQDDASVPRSLGPLHLLSRVAAEEPYAVYSAKHGPHGLPVLALVASSPGPGVEPLRREVRWGQRLRHPGIMPVVEVVEGPEQLAVALSRHPGKPLSELLRRVGLRSGRFPPHAASFVAMELLEALGAAHEAVDEEGRRLDVVHRALTLDRVWVGFGGEIQLRGFGYASARNEEGIDPPSGWPAAFAAPDHVQRRFDPRTDLFGVGAVLYALLSGRAEAPSPRPGLERVIPDVNPRLAYIVRRLTASDRSERFSAALHVRDELARIVYSEDPTFGRAALGRFVTEVTATDATAEGRQESLLSATLAPAAREEASIRCRRCRTSSPRRKRSLASRLLHAEILVAHRCTASGRATSFGPASRSGATPVHATSRWARPCGPASAALSHGIRRPSCLRSPQTLISTRGPSPRRSSKCPRWRPGRSPPPWKIQIPRFVRSRIPYESHRSPMLDSSIRSPLHPRPPSQRRLLLGGRGPSAAASRSYWRSAYWQ
ncbi:MAG: hypothetical protein HC923_05960 [Myxococcales bacterium]|nr:hypothetical protein [Myxococcales bacterium]